MRTHPRPASSTDLRRWRAVVPAVLIGVVCTTAPIAGSEAVPAPGRQCLPEEGGVPLSEALGSQDPAARAVAARVQQRLGSAAPTSPDPTLMVSGCERAFYVEHPITPRDLARASRALGSDARVTARAPGGAGAAPASPASPRDVRRAFDLSSSPGADLTIYLDFTGDLTEDTVWNSMYGEEVIVSAPYDLDGSEETFSDVELAAVHDIWEAVAEDFAAFEVDVTTAEPRPGALLRATTSDTRYGTRVVFTGANTVRDGCFCQGITDIGIFDFVGTASARAQPAFVFTDLGAGEIPRIMADTASHEVGHNFGLSHDGIDRDGVFNDYYQGVDPWTPIMGNSYFLPLAQWSRGSYEGATNTEDDLAVIARHAPWVEDDVTDTVAGARSMLVSGGTVTETVDGLVGASVLGDQDVHALDLGAGAVVDVALVPTDPTTALDTRLTLLAPDGTVLAESAPPAMATGFDTTGGLDSSIDAFTVPTTGRYHLVVAGAGQGDARTGYDSYGSIGTYRLTVTASGGDEPEVLVGPLRIAGQLGPGRVGEPYVGRLVARGGEPPFTWDHRGRLPRGLLLTDTDTDMGPRSIGIVGRPRSEGSVAVTVVVTDALGTTARHTEQVRVRPRRR